MDFEKIYKSCNSQQSNHLTEDDIENTKKEDNIYINSRGEEIERITLTEEEEQNLWYEQEEGNPEIFVEYKNFTWQRCKSNECVTDTRRGKGGFSFYYAIHAFDDPYLLTLPDENHSSQDNGTRVNSIGIAPGIDKTLVVTNADLNADGQLRIISAILADETNKPNLFNSYWKNRLIRERFSTPSKLKDSIGNETYLVIRKAKGQRYDQNSLAKVVSSLDVKKSGNNYLYKGIPVFIQNYGTKEKCESIQRGVKFDLNHFGLGEDW